MDMQEQIQEFFATLDTLYSRGNVTDTENFLLDTKRETLPAQGDFHPLYLASLSELGAFYKGVSRYADSLGAFEEASLIIEKEIGRETRDYAVNMNNIAGTYRLMGETEQSLARFEEARVILGAIGEIESFPYASILNNMALLQQEKGEYETAIELIRQSVGICAKLAGSEDAVATSKLNLASLYRLTGQKDQARQAADQAIELFEGLPLSAHYAAALNIRAVLDVEDGDYAQAKERYLLALEKTNHFFGENIEYAILCESLAAVCGKLGQEDETTRYLKNALQVFEKVLGPDHERTRRIAAALA